MKLKIGLNILQVCFLFELGRKFRGENKWIATCVTVVEAPTTTKTARDEVLRAKQNARGHDKDRITVKAILSCEV